MPGGGRVDVSIETMTMILNRRTDLQDLYRANLRPNGVPWYPLVNSIEQPDVVAIITDWWTRVAGQSDDPSLYGYSLKRFVEVQFSIPGAAQPGDAGKTIQSDSIIAGVSANMFIGGTFALVVLLMTIGSTRKQRLTYAETTGASGLGALIKGRGRR